MKFTTALSKVAVAIECRENVSMRDYSTFRAGGPAAYFVEPNDSNELVHVILAAQKSETPYYVIGNGSNILVSDRGFDGVIIHIGKKFSNIEIIEKNDEFITIEAEAGALLSSFGNLCAKEGYEGAEFCCGIPGNIGGAIYMNAGAYGREMKDIVTQVTYLDTESMTIEKLSNEQCEFGYRTSTVEKKGGIVISARMKMAKGDAEQIKNYVAELREKRTTSQPLDVPSAGSTFKRPEGFFAGKLIQDAGLKGITIDHSGAQVSPKHAGFVVNNGGTATATDIYRLIKYVINKVFENSGVHLEPEVRLIGFDKDK